KVSGEVSVLFEKCRVHSRLGAGIRVATSGDDAPAGMIEFRQCVIEDTDGCGIQLRDKNADGPSVRFVNCLVRGAARRREPSEPWTPILFDESKPGRTLKPGGVEFLNCRLEDDFARPALVADVAGALSELKGVLTLRNRHGVT